MKLRIQDKILEIATLSIITLGISLGLSEPAEGQNDLYYGDNHGGDVSDPPDGCIFSQELTDNFGLPTAVDAINNTYYEYVYSHWFDPQQMAQFPSDVWMHGVAPYDHHPSTGSE